MMLLTTLFGPEAAGDLDGAAARLAAHPALRDELRALLADRAEHQTMPWVRRSRLPLEIHARWAWSHRPGSVRWTSSGA